MLLVLAYLKDDAWAEPTLMWWGSLGLNVCSLGVCPSLRAGMCLWLWLLVSVLGHECLQGEGTCLDTFWSCWGSYVFCEPWVHLYQHRVLCVSECVHLSESLHDFCPPLMSSILLLQLEGDTITLKPRPSADLTNSNAPSPSNKVQRSVSANPKQRRFSDQGKCFWESQGGTKGLVPLQRGSGSFG